MSNTGTNVLEIDAIGVDEWEHEQHTPRAMDENLAALVKQSSAQSGPVRAPTLDNAWETDSPAAAAPAEPAKQRTTTNTVARPAPPKTKTMALPTVAAVKPAAPKPAAPKPAAPPKPIAAKPIPPKPSLGDEPPPGFVEVKPLAARAAPKPPSAARATPTPKSTPQPTAAVTAAPKPAAKPAAKPTPPPIATIDPKPTAKPTPPPLAAVDPKPAASEDWDNAPGAATSVDNRVSPSPPRPVTTGARPEESIIVNLDATPTADKPRPQTFPVLQTSVQSSPAPSVSMMPTAAQPPAMALAPEGERASSPGWHTPLPQRVPGEPLATPAAPVWPSASGLVYDPSLPHAHEPAAPLAARRGVAAALLPLIRRRGVAIAIAGAAVLAIVFVIASQGSSDSKPATAAATPASKTGPIASADSTSPTVPAPVLPAAAPAPTAAAAGTVAPSPKSPTKTPLATHRISRHAQPVVVDYDKKPTSSPLDPDQALAQAREAYSIGNQHLFTGENREAISEYRKALSIYPSYAAGYRGLGLAFAELDDKPSAIAAFKTYLKLAPSAKDRSLIQKRIRSLSVH